MVTDAPPYPQKRESITQTNLLTNKTNHKNNAKQNKTQKTTTKTDQPNKKQTNKQNPTKLVGSGKPQDRAVKK